MVTAFLFQCFYHHNQPSTMYTILGMCYIYIYGLVQEWRNSSALAMELRLSCTNPSLSFANSKSITVTSNKCQAIPVYVPIGCVFSSLFRLSSKEISKLCITGFLWTVDSHYKGPVMWKTFQCHDVIMLMYITFVIAVLYAVLRHIERWLCHFPRRVYDSVLTSNCQLSWDFTWVILI